MLTLVFPQRIDNTYRGHPLALWLFALVLLSKTSIALATIFNGRTAAQSADGIPIDSFGPGGAEAVVALFAMWGLGHLMLNVLGIVALIRYRAMIPLVFVLLLTEHLARRWVLAVTPIGRTGTPAGQYIQLAQIGLMVVGLALSLRPRTHLAVTACST